MLGATSAGAFDSASDAEQKAFMALLINSNGDPSAEVNSVMPPPGRNVCRIGCTEVPGGQRAGVLHAERPHRGRPAERKATRALVRTGAMR